jgi:hypothetical protein
MTALARGIGNAGGSGCVMHDNVVLLLSSVLCLTGALLILFAR